MAVISTQQLAVDALGIAVAFGIGFLIWTLAHLLRESRPPTQPAKQLYESRPLRR